MSRLAEAPALGLGTWQVPPENVADLVYTAIVNGVRHIDCACDYGNEKQVGDGLVRALSEGIVKREELWVTSKLWNSFHHPDHVPEAFSRTLEDLQLEYLDLYLIHFPIASEYVDPKVRYPPGLMGVNNDKIILDSNTSIAQTWAAMEELVASGKVSHIGVSNFNVQLLTELCKNAKIRPSMNQIELHPFLSQKKMVAYCQDVLKVRLTAYSPFGGVSYQSFNPSLKDQPVNALTHPVIVAIAERLGTSTGVVALRWALDRGLVAIFKSSNPDRIRSNMAALNAPPLSSDDAAAIDALNINYRLNDPGVYGTFMGLCLPIFE